MAKKTFFITTPIYYASGKPHIGSAYTTIAADMFARWKNLKGNKVFFLTGTDEHGQKIQEAAEKAGKTPKKFVDEISKEFQDAFKLLNINEDNFIRTTNPYHEKEVQKVLQELYDKKYIYKGLYEALYCVGCEQYKTDSDLVNGKCPLHKIAPEHRKEEAYLFKLSMFQNKLLKLIKSEKFSILPETRRNEIITFIESGLKDVSFSRLKEKVYWGIELPFDKKHTTFVWVDAFWNYITGLKDNKSFDQFWPPNIQLMAKDIMRVHATIWPALLLATKNKIPETLFVHGYFTINGEKMSKSLGNAISPIYLANKYGADAIRYYLFRNISFGEDGDFSEHSLIERNNNELANKLGNLVSRVSTLVEKYGLEKAMPINIKPTLKKVEKYFEKYELDKALSEIFTFIDECNVYIQGEKPWETQDKKVLWKLSNAIKDIAILLSPFMPETAEKIAKTFNFNISLKELNKPLKISKIKKSDILFKKIEENDKPKSSLINSANYNINVTDNKDNKKINKQSDIQGVINMADMIKYNDFAKLDLRVGTIKKAEDIQNADKLLKLEVDIGNENRTILAGIKKYYKKEELIGKQIIVIVNLEPRKMKNIESQGMLLAAGSKDEDTCVLISPEKSVKAGLKIN